MHNGNKTTSMTEGPPVPLILRFAFPLILGNLLQQFYAVVDTIVVGQGVGISALASMGAADWLNWLMLWMIQGFTQGFAVLVAQKFGADDLDSLKKSIAMSTIISLLLGLLFTVAGLLAANPILRLLNTPSNIIAGSWEYLRIIFSGTLVIVAYNMASYVLRSLGDSKTPLVAMGIAATINIVLDLLLVLALDWGISGAAIATVIAQSFSFLYCLRAIRRISMIQLQKEDWKIESNMCRHLLRLGIPMSLSQGIIAVGGMAVQFVVNGYGFLFVAGFTATNKLYGILECTAISFGFSMSTYMGQNYGACRLERIHVGMRSMQKVSIGVAVAISTSMIVFGKRLIRLFVSGDPVDAAAVVNIAYQYLLVMSCFLFILYLLHIYRTSLQGLGNAKIPAVSGLIEFFMRVGVAMLLPRLMGEAGIFLAEAAAWTGATTYLICGYYREINRIDRTWNQGTSPYGQLTTNAL